MDDRELNDLAAAFREGDLKSFELLVEALTRPLIALAFRYTQDWEWARDLTQETWIKVHDRIRLYRPGRPFGAWLYAVHRNGCVDHLRRGWVRQESSPGDEVVHGLAGASAQNPEEEVERQEFHQRLLAAVAELSESQRQVFLRVDLEQGDQKEVARALGIRFGTLRTTLHFARKRLARALQEWEEIT